MPGDLVAEAVDGEDLARAMLEQNVSRVDDESAKHRRETLAYEAKQKIRDQYEKRAMGVYKELWKRCQEKGGHAFRSIDTGAYTLKVCDVCSNAKPHSREDKGEQNSAERYNRNLATNLATEMISLDEAAGAIVWPEPDDFIGVEFEKGGFLRRRFK
jgi:hypothetical protein